MKNANPKRTKLTRKLRLEDLERRELLCAAHWSTECGVASHNTECVEGPIATSTQEINLTALMSNGVSGAVSGGRSALKGLVEAGQDPNAISESFIFNLQSNPNSTKTIYLDVKGNTLTNHNWNAYVNVDQIVTPKFDLDGDESTFANDELLALYEIWQRVSEDYAPFDVNVTLKEPTAGMLAKTSASDASYGIRVCIGATPIRGSNNQSQVFRSKNRSRGTLTRHASSSFKRAIRSTL